MSHTVGRIVASLVAVAATALVLAACGSSNSSSAAGSAAAKSGSSTITVGTAISVNSPVLNDAERKAGVEAAISDIDAAGGINGHQVKLDFCDTQYSVNGEINCAR